MKNAGIYNKKILIFKIQEIEDKEGFPIKQEIPILRTYANVKTTKGFTLIVNNSDFEKAYTNFTIRYPKKKIDRSMWIKYNQKVYSIEYLNNIDEENVELEIQAKVVEK